MVSVKGKLTLETPDGCRRLLVIYIAAILFFSFLGAVISSNGGKVKISSLTIDSRGAEINIDQYVPAGISDSDKLPCVLLAHGRGTTKNALRGVAEELARRGFVVLNVNAYGQGLSEQPVSDEAGQGAKGFFIYTSDAYGQLDALNFARTLNYIDPERIAIYGHSLGGMRAMYTASVDSGYFTLNDLLINVLYNTFNQSFSVDEIEQNADGLAAARLSTQQLTHYKSIREEKVKYYNTRLSTVISGSNPATSKVSVGGHTVTRECQINVIVLNGKYDALGAGATWRKDGTTDETIMGGVDIDSWYRAAHDGSGLSKIGTLGAVNILNNKELASAIKDRSARIACYAPVSHSGIYFNNEANMYTVETLSQALNYNRGNLTDSETKPLDPKSNVWFLRAVCNLITMLCMLAMIFPIIGLLTKIKYFAPCVVEVKTTSTGNISKTSYWIFGALTAVLTFLALYKANTLGPTWASGIMYKFPPKIFTLVTVSSVGVWFIIMTTAASLILFIVKILVIKRTNGGSGLEELNIKIKFTVFLKTLLISIITLAAGFSMLTVIIRLFNQDFRFFETMFAEMKAESWIYGIPYFVVFIVLYFVINLGVNYAGRKDISGRMEMILNIFINSIGAWFLFFCNYISQITWNGKAFSDFTLSYSMMLFIPVSVYISRKIYRMTNSVWLGSFVDALLLSWLMVSKSGIGDSYYGQNIISILFNV
jgi:acetyl esterase/lipase